MIGYTERNNSAGQLTLPAYSIQTESWETVGVSAEPQVPHQPQHESDLTQIASSYDGGGSLSFLYELHAGSNSNGSFEHNIDMVTFDSSDPSSLSWNVHSNVKMPFIGSGATQFVRFGTAGVLVSVGGFSKYPSLNSSRTNASGTNLAQSNGFNATHLRDMAQIQIYDIAAKKWFEVNATGDTPQPRYDLCSALSAAPDDSSFQMIIYGGGAADSLFADIYVLTMPAFHWIKINATVTDDDSTNPSSSSKSTNAGRMGHFCGTYKDRQMLVIGGTDENWRTHSGCAGNHSSLTTLDTTTFHWQTRFPINESYQVPKAVIDVVGGGPNGGARPAGSWAQTLGDNVALFNKTIPKYEPPIIKRNTDPFSTFPPVSTFPPHSTGKPTGGVTAGVTIGAITGSLLVGVTAFFIKNRRRRGRREEKDEQEDWHKPELENSAKQMAEIDGSERAHEELDGRPIWVEVPGAEHAREAPAAEHSCEMPG